MQLFTATVGQFNADATAVFAVADALHHAGDLQVVHGVGGGGHADGLGLSQLADTAGTQCLQGHHDGQLRAAELGLRGAATVEQLSASQKRANALSERQRSNGIRIANRARR